MREMSCAEMAGRRFVTKEVHGGADNSLRCGSRKEFPAGCESVQRARLYMSLS